MEVKGGVASRLGIITAKHRGNFFLSILVAHWLYIALKPLYYRMPLYGANRMFTYY